MPYTNRLSSNYEKHTNIALDYDETFTSNRSLWTQFVSLVKQYNCTITFVTYRFENSDNKDICNDAETLGIDIVFSGGNPKSSVFKADIWIDDSPVTIPSYHDMQEMLDNAPILNK